MLGSITWLGESGRNARWWVTVAWFGVGAVGAGALVGWLMGLLGAALSGAAGPREAAAALALLAVAGIAADLRLGGLRLPTVRRQVDDRWLNRYRGWVYGVGFGFQLGLGVVTVVTTSAVYLAFAAAVLSGSPAAGALIGAVFGAVRWLSVLPGGRVRRSADLVRMDGQLRRWEPAGRRVTLGGQIAAAMLLAVVVGSHEPVGPRHPGRPAARLGGTDLQAARSGRSAGRPRGQRRAGAGRRRLRHPHGGADAGRRRAGRDGRVRAGAGDNGPVRARSACRRSIRPRPRRRTCSAASPARPATSGSSTTAAGRSACTW